MQQHLQMSLTLCTGTLKHMTVSRCVFKAAAQPGFPTSLTTLALNNVTLGLDQVFLALSPLNNLQVLCFCHDTYSYIPLKHLLQYSRKECSVCNTLSAEAHLVQDHGICTSQRICRTGATKWPDSRAQIFLLSCSGPDTRNATLVANDQATDSRPWHALYSGIYSYGQVKLP